ncbi:T9SS type A sorting domain-containing protein [Saccharicrinis sp. FJH2]|uniref:T9SS type A sorting domain-containing protein n=1 Tax=Saccharicrinis sp. FJH65 TaxID=3344659 RepID=UPI0035F2BFB1
MIRRGKIITLIGFIISAAVISFGQRTPYPIKISGSQRLDSIYVQILDTVNGFWNIYQKKEFTYEMDSGIIYQIGSIWNNYNKKWVPDIKIVYIQDENGSLIHKVEYKRWVIAKKWLESQKMDYVYESNNKLTELVIYKWLNNNILGEWRLYGKKDYSYENTQLVTENENIWDSTDSTWQPMQKTEYSFNPEGNLTNEKRFRWNIDLNEWNKLPHEEYLYNSSGNAILYRRGTGVFSVEGDFSYDINGNLLEYSEWSKSNEIDWRLLRLINYTYDTMFSINKLLLPPRYVELDEMNTHLCFTNKLTERLFLDYSFYGYSTKETYYYSEQSGTPLQNTVNVEYRLYPNPVRDFVEIDIKSNDNVTFELYDLQGQCLLIEDICCSKKVYLKNLSPGLYIYNLNVNGIRRSGKLMKE